LSDGPLLEVRDLNVVRGKRQILCNISLSVGRGEIVALIGPNGSGKSTVLKTVMGLLPRESGQVCLDGQSIEPEPRRMLAAGIRYVPQTNGLFRDLTVLENLRIAATAVGKECSESNVVEQAVSRHPFLTPKLRRMAGTLSGGEQQMLSVICGFLLSPRLLLLDEPSGSLTQEKAKAVLGNVKTVARQGNTATLIVEQHVHEVIAVADRVVVLRRGSVAFDGSATELGTGPELGRRLLF